MMNMSENDSKGSFLGGIVCRGSLNQQILDHLPAVSHRESQIAGGDRKI